MKTKIFNKTNLLISAVSLFILFAATIGIGFSSDSLNLKAMVAFASSSEGSKFYSKQESLNGFMVPADTYVYFQCPDNIKELKPWGLGFNNKNYGVIYHMSGEEMIRTVTGNKNVWNGRFLVSPSYLKRKDNNRYNEEDTVKGGDFYYIHVTPKPTYFDCVNGAVIADDNFLQNCQSRNIPSDCLGKCQYENECLGTSKNCTKECTVKKVDESCPDQGNGSLDCNQCLQNICRDGLTKQEAGEFCESYCVDDLDESCLDQGDGSINCNQCLEIECKNNVSKAEAGEACKSLCFEPDSQVFHYADAGDSQECIACLDNASELFGDKSSIREYCSFSCMKYDSDECTRPSDSVSCKMCLMDECEKDNSLDRTGALSNCFRECKSSVGNSCLEQGNGSVNCNYCLELGCATSSISKEDVGGLCEYYCAEIKGPYYSDLDNEQQCSECKTYISKITDNQTSINQYCSIPCTKYDPAVCVRSSDSPNCKSCLQNACKIEKLQRLEALQACDHECLDSPYSSGCSRIPLTDNDCDNYCAIPNICFNSDVNNEDSYQCMAYCETNVAEQENIRRIFAPKNSCELVKEEINKSITDASSCNDNLDCVEFNISRIACSVAVNINAKDAIKNMINEVPSYCLYQYPFCEDKDRKSECINNQCVSVDAPSVMTNPDECRYAGGIWKFDDSIQEYHCIVEHTDGGSRCNDPSQCDGLCVSDTNSDEGYCSYGGEENLCGKYYLSSGKVAGVFPCLGGFGDGSSDEPMI